MSSFGSTVGSDTMICLKKIGKQMWSVTGEKKSLYYLLQRISVAIQRANAVNVLGSFPQKITISLCKIYC